MGKNRSLDFKASIWLNEDTGYIHITGRSENSEFISTVTHKPGLKRCHEHLYNHLKSMLVADGKWPDEK